VKLEKLEKLYADCRQNPNYQYKDLSDESFLKKSAISFKKLSERQQTLVLDSWAKQLGKGRPLLNQEEIHGLLQLRFLAQTNLFFLCHLLEKYNQTTLQTHEDICNDFFVKKDPTFLTFEHFANQYTDLKQRMLLVPRGGFKSSIDMADCVQWTICFPAVTMLILTGSLRLSNDFIGEVKQHFTLEQTNEINKKGKPIFDVRQLMDKETGDWSNSLFQVLFAEHCVPPEDGIQSEFQTPAGGDDKEPTLRVASIEQALSGMHFGILKLDDVVTNENSKTITRIKDVNKQISINKAMMHPYGFFDVIGTWYDEQDFYGATIKKEEKFAVEEGLLESIKGSVDSGQFNSSVHFKVYLRACWWPTDEAKKVGKIEEEMKKADWTLWFPERLTYEFLTKEQKNDSDLDSEDGDTGYFAIKYLNNPRKINKIKFPKELLIRRTIPHTQYPPGGIVVTAVDTAYSVKQWADYTVILTAIIYGGRFYIVNMVRGRYNEFDLPRIIAQTGNKWKPKRIAIEDSVGVKWMGRELRREMDKLQISIPVEYVTLGYGSKLRSKQLKAKPVLRLLGDERLYFFNSCEGLEEIYNEMEKFTGTSDDTHDDIVSAISLLVEQFGSYADMDAKVNSINQEYTANRQSTVLHNMIYGLGRFAKYNASNMEDNPVTAFQLEQKSEVLQDQYSDPLSDLM
jgi:phage terminase large subunit-like protein